MAFEEALETRTLLASGDLSASQYRFVVLDASGNAALAGANVKAYGVLQTKPSAAGQECTVAVDGISKVVAGGAIPVGSPVETDGSGRAIAAVTAGHQVIGIARKAAAALGEIIPVEVDYYGVV